jgi:hypothetical protein
MQNAKKQITQIFANEITLKFALICVFCVICVQKINAQKVVTLPRKKTTH